MPPGKLLVHSVSGRHDDDRWRNAPGVFRNASETFFNFQSLPSRHGNCRSACRHRMKFFEVHYTPVTSNRFHCITKHSRQAMVKFRRGIFSNFQSILMLVICESCLQNTHLIFFLLWEIIRLTHSVICPLKWPKDLRVLGR